MKQARSFVLQSGICGIFSDDQGRMPSLWNVVDLPGRQPGEKGWGQKITAIWRWKNELPAVYPTEIFYGKIPGGLAVLMSLPHLRARHYPATHRPLKDCSPLAQRIFHRLRFDPMTTSGLRAELEMTQRPEKARFDRALLELQVTLNIARRNSLADENDTWVPFSEPYLEVVRGQATLRNPEAASDKPENGSSERNPKSGRSGKESNILKIRIAADLARGIKRQRRKAS